MDNLTAQELGQKINSARKLRRLTQREVAEKLNVHPSMVTRWEKGQMHPKDKTLEAIAAALGFTIEELLNLKGAGTRNQSLHNDQEMQRCLELLARMSEEDRKMVKHMIQALAFRHQVQSLGQAV
jgi:transcriptional regulator with XRE-family HTH domain